MAISTDNAQVVVNSGRCEGSDVRTFNAHHRKFPEVTGEGGSEIEAVERLGTQMELALEHNAGGHGHDELEKALDDVRQFQAIH